MAAAAWTCPMMLRAWLLGTTALLPAASALAQGVAPNALPTGGQVAAGQAAISQSGTAMQVRQGSDRAAINWQGFNVGANASVNFQQPSATSWTLNRVTGPDPSVIAGRITANGGVAIVNQSGMVFARGAQVNVGSLIASAANITNENFMAGRMVFDGAPKPGAKVENHGSITVSDRGLAALVGPRVGNTGTIRARLGRVALAGAETYSLDLAGDGLLSIDVTQAVRTAEGGATALVTNSGVIEAQGGAVLITAHAASGLVEDLVRNTGRISADTAAGRTGQVALRAEGGGVRVEGQVTARGGAAAPGGRVELRGSTATTVAGAARVDASGGAGGGTVLVGTSGVGRNQSMSARTSVEAGARLRADARRQGNGGTIAVNSTTETVARGSYSARGGARGGDGGLVELSGQRALTIAAQVDLAAAAGRRGTLLLDPVSIEVVADAETPADPDRPLNTVTATTGGGGTVRVRASDLDVAGTVTLQAEQNITISTAVNIGTNTLNLHADGAITQASLATITAGTLVIRGKDGTGAAGLVNLNQANSVGFLSAQVNGSLTFDNGTGNLTVTAATGSTVALLTKGSLTLQGSVGQSGAAVSLNVDGAISQTAGAITGASLTIAGVAAAAPASIDLTQANALGMLNAQSAGDLAFTNGNTALTVSRATSGGDNAAVSLTSGLGITLAGAVGGAGAGTVGTTGAAVMLTAGGTISQSNGAVTAQGLAVTATGGSIALTQPGNEIAGLTATATGTGHGIAVRSGQVMSILAGGVTAGGGSTIGLTAQGLTAGHAVGFAAADPANRISLVADAIAATAAIDAGSSGTIAIAPLSTNRDVDIGGTTAGALQIGAPTFGRLTARHIDIAATGSGALAVSIDVAAAELSLAAGGDITQASGKAITAAALTATSGAGAITLDQSNAVAALDATASSGAVSFRNGTADLAVAKAIGTVVTLTTAGALEVRGAVGQDGAAVGLHVGGAISQTGGVVTASTLTIRDATGTAGTAAASIDLGRANAIASLDAKATGTLNLANGSADLTVAQATGSSVTLTTGGALALGGAVGQSGAAVTLQADGAITQTASGLVTAATLTVRGAPGGTSGAESLTLDRMNMVGTLNARVTNGLVLGNGGNNLIVAQAVGSSVTLTTGGALALQGPVGQSGAAVRLNVTGALSQTDGTVTAGSLTVRDATGLAGTGAASIALDQLNAIASANATASGALSLTNGVTSLAVTQALGSSVTLATAGALTLEGAVGQAGAGVTLNASGAISQTAAGLVTASKLTIRGAGGGTTPAASAKLDQANTVDALDARVTSELLLRSSATSLAAVQAVGSTVTLTTGGALDLQGTVGQAGGTVNLNVTGAVTQSDGIVQAGTLTVRDAAGSGHAASIALGRANAVARSMRRRWAPSASATAARASP
jgi:filamentous hemagglutinin family protein